MGKKSKKKAQKAQLKQAASPNLQQLFQQLLQGASQASQRKKVAPLPSKKQGKAQASNPAFSMTMVDIPNESEELLQNALRSSREAFQQYQEEKKRKETEKTPDAARSSTRNWNEKEYVYRPKPTEAKYASGNPSLVAARQALPVFAYRKEILQTIESNQVCIIEGETGCGKTTQVAQYIVEHYCERGWPCSVLCTQPRRISAIGVAERVADERGETIGDAVGYSVRMENKVSRETCLLFCTTGILLRRLEEDHDLQGTTHVLIDEVHERGVESDFLLLALKNLCNRRHDLHVVLMSATMDKSLFGNYFGAPHNNSCAPSLVVPGRTFPVETFFLEDALRATQHQFDTNADWAIGGGKGKGKGKSGGNDSEHSEDARKREDLSEMQVSLRYKDYPNNVKQALTQLEQDEVNYDLLVELICGNTLERMGTHQAPESKAFEGKWRGHGQEDEWRGHSQEDDSRGHGQEDKWRDHGQEEKWRGHGQEEKWRGPSEEEEWRGHSEENKWTGHESEPESSHKEMICFDWINGLCKNGESCQFRHRADSEDEDDEWSQGQGQDQGRGYGQEDKWRGFSQENEWKGHSQENNWRGHESKPESSDKVTICFDWINGTCKHGESCQFRHRADSEDEEDEWSQGKVQGQDQGQKDKWKGRGQEDEWSTVRPRDRSRSRSARRKSTGSKWDEPKASERPTGILVFLSGAKEIERLMERLFETKEFRDEPGRSWVLPLHGMLPMDDQRKPFHHPPRGIRKIVLSTNVAETSITIDDIGYVIDTCRMKEMRYDPVRRMSSLEDTVVSQTNARQRRGRAGRVAPGLAVHSGLTRYRHDSLIDDHQPPEVQRVPLEQLVLRIHAIKLHQRTKSGKAAEVCKDLIEPPPSQAVMKAVERLEQLGAILILPSGAEQLTALGEHLTNLPLDARLGKLVLFSAAFGAAAVDASLTVAAALQSRSPFVSPLENRHHADEAKMWFSKQALSNTVGHSDHLTLLKAYREWDSLPLRGRERSWYCRKYFLSLRTLEGMSELKRELLQTMSELRFLPSGLLRKDVKRIGDWYGSDGVLRALMQSENPQNYDWHAAPPEPCPPALVAGLLCVALFPQVTIATATAPSATALFLKLGGGSSKPKFSILDEASKEPTRVTIHPSSVSRKTGDLTSPFMVYQELVKSNSQTLFVRDVTAVPPLALALFGGNLDSDAKQTLGTSVLTIGGWIRLSVPAPLKEPLLQVRKDLDSLLIDWVSHKGKKGAGMRDQVSHAELLEPIVQLLSVPTKTKLSVEFKAAPMQIKQKAKQKTTPKSPLPGNIKVGDMVKLHGLTSDKGQLLNGRVGKITSLIDGSQRCAVAVKGATLAFKTENLIFLGVTATTQSDATATTQSDATATTQSNAGDVDI